MSDVTFIPSKYCLLRRNEHVAWMVYCDHTNKIIDAHAKAIRFHSFNDRVSTFIGAGYKQIERGDCTLEKYMELKEKYGTRD